MAVNLGHMVYLVTQQFKMLRARIVVIPVTHHYKIRDNKLLKRAETDHFILLEFLGNCKRKKSL